MFYQLIKYRILIRRKFIDIKSLHVMYYRPFDRSMALYGDQETESASLRRQCGKFEENYLTFFQLFCVQFALKGRCHGDLVVFWSKLLKYLTNNLLLT